MGCLVGNVTRVSEGLRMGVGRIGANLQLSVTRVSEGLRMGVGLVCTTNDVFYIKVTPQVIWLTEANNFMGRIDVDSNTNWRIEIKEEDYGKGRLGKTE